MATEDAVKIYLREIASQLVSGYAREHAYRPALQRLMRSFDDVEAINDPKRSENGNPDFIFQKKDVRAVIVGYAETKDIGAPLDRVLKSEQMRRYSGYENLFLTDYLDFRFLRNGEEVDQVRIGRVLRGKIVQDIDQLEVLREALTTFLNQNPAKITSGYELAQLMGAKTRRIRDEILEFFLDNPDERHSLVKIFNLLRSQLVHDLDHAGFADLYAQTLVYGLFVARYYDDTPETFSRQEARYQVPSSNPFLQRFFDHIVGPDFDHRLARSVDELCETFRVSSVRDIVFVHLGGSTDAGDRDPILYFYEDFLQAYDPVIRKRMGAYYTRAPIARYIVRQVDSLLKSEFGVRRGLADTSKIDVEHDLGGQVYRAYNPQSGRRTRKKTTQTLSYHRVQVLDPAAGTGTFLNEVISYVHASMAGQQGRWESYVNNDLLPRLHGFELMMAPYTIAHLKLSMSLAETGARELRSRLGVYLTNTLEEGAPFQPDLFSIGLAEAVTEESNAAGRVKSERPVMVVLGNPPYAGISSNETEFANGLIEMYKVEPGGHAKLNEKKHWLNDDYVKFIAFGQTMIQRSGEGILALITNHAYLDNPTFRGMRWQLARAFDTIYVLDLHGNVKRGEVAPDGQPDEGVFDIQQGTAILLAVLRGTESQDALATVRHGELWGRREAKFKRMESNEIEWTEIKLDPRMVYFRPIATDTQEDYEYGVALDDLFLEFVTGVVTARDSVVIDTDDRRLLRRIERFSDVENFSDADTRAWLFPSRRAGKYKPGDSRGWKLDTARRAIASNAHESKIDSILYRPFDERSIYYAPEMIDWGRFKFYAKYWSWRNPALVSVRRVPEKSDHSYIFVSDRMVSNGAIRSDSVSIDASFPLYRRLEDGSIQSNLSPTALKRLCVNLDRTPSPDDVLDFAYGSLCSTTYQARYLERLKLDYPRVPIPADSEEFEHVSYWGNRLRQLHLMVAADVDGLAVTYPVAGSDRVDGYSFKSNQVWINSSQYFGEVSRSVWEFWIGGYQPSQKWLKDRKGTMLSAGEIEHYQLVLHTLQATIEGLANLEDFQLSWKE